MQSIVESIIYRKRNLIRDIYDKSLIASLIDF